MSRGAPTIGGAPLPQMRLADVYVYMHHLKYSWQRRRSLSFTLTCFDTTVVPIVNNAGLAIFTVRPASGSSARGRGFVVAYVPSMKISTIVCSFSTPYVESGYNVPLAAPAVTSDGSATGIWVLNTLSEASENPELIATKVSFRVPYRRFLVGTVGNPLTDSSGYFNVDPASKPIYLFLHTDGGITNLKMNIVAAAEQAYRNNLVFVLPDMATDWVQSRKEQLAAGESTLILNKCGQPGVKCRSFQEVFDADSFIQDAKAIGLIAVRNTLPKGNSLRFPSIALNKIDRSSRYLKAIHMSESTITILCIKDHLYCHRKDKSICNMAKASAMGASFALTGIANYWHFNFTLSSQLTRRDAFFQALKPNRYIKEIISKVFDKIKNKTGHLNYYALHLRIEPEVQVHCKMEKYKDMVDCYVPKEEVIKRLPSHIPPGSLLYVAVGNSPEKNEALEMLGRTYDIVSKETLYPQVKDALQHQREWLALVDQEICLNSKKFVGSRPSSFSFLVAAMRSKMRLPWAYYNDKDIFPGQLQTHSTDFVRNAGENFLPTYK